LYQFHQVEIKPFARKILQLRMDEGYLHKGGKWTDIKEFQAGTCHLLVLNAAFETIARPLLTPKRKVWGAASLVRQVAAT
jgi:hypothetical protein